MNALLPAIVPVSLIIAIGYLAGFSLTLDRQTLSHLTLYILVPALIASSLYQATLPVMSALGLVVGFGCTSGLSYGLVILLGKLLKFPADLEKSLVATTLFANSGNLGLPLITVAFGDAGRERAVVYLIAASILLAIAGPVLLKREGLGVGLRVTLQLPLMWATIAGILLNLLALPLPLRLDQGMEMLGSAAIPVALVLLGVQLSQIRLALGWYELFASGMRLVVSPLVAYGVGVLLRLEVLDLQVLVMQSAMPAAVNNLIWVTEFGGDPPRVARTIVISTVLSFVTLPTILWLSRIGG